MNRPLSRLPAADRRPGPVIPADTIAAAAAGDTAAVETVTSALRADRAINGAPQIASDAPATQVQQLLLRLPASSARRLVSALPDPLALATLADLDPPTRASMLGGRRKPRFAALLAALDGDAVADFVAELPPSLVDALLHGNPQASRIRAAIDHEPATVGALMHRTPLLIVSVDWPVERVVAAVRDRQADPLRRGTIPLVCAVDDDGHLVGTLDLTQLLVSAPGTVSGDLVRDVVAVAASVDQEEAVRLADRHRLAEIAVVDADNRPCGLVSAEELRDIVRDEASEDIMALSGAAADAKPADSPMRILITRFPWLVSALIGAVAAGMIIGYFEDELEQAVVLASLIPLVMDMAGNAGIQSSAVTIEMLARPQYWGGDTRARLLREFFGSLLNGAAVAAVAALVIVVLGAVTDLEEPLRLALTAAATLIAIIVQAALVGVLVPLGLKRIRLDPAVGTGVFITTINDFAGITILFVFASTFYLPYV